jgi:hypothetical protein
MRKKNLFPLGGRPNNKTGSTKGKGSLGSVGKRLGLVDTPSLPKELKKRGDCKGAMV